MMFVFIPPEGATLSHHDSVALSMHDVMNGSAAVGDDDEDWSSLKREFSWSSLSSDTSTNDVIHRTSPDGTTVRQSSICRPNIDLLYSKTATINDGRTDTLNSDCCKVNDEFSVDDQHVNRTTKITGQTLEDTAILHDGWLVDASDVATTSSTTTIIDESLPPVPTTSASKNVDGCVKHDEKKMERQNASTMSSAAQAVATDAVEISLAPKSLIADIVRQLVGPMVAEELNAALSRCDTDTDFVATGSKRRGPSGGHESLPNVIDNEQTKEDEKGGKTTALRETTSMPLADIVADQVGRRCQSFLDAGRPVPGRNWKTLKSTDDERRHVCIADRLVTKPRHVRRISFVRDCLGNSTSLTTAVTRTTRESGDRCQRDLVTLSPRQRGASERQSLPVVHESRDERSRTKRPSAVGGNPKGTSEMGTCGREHQSSSEPKIMTSSLYIYT